MIVKLLPILINITIVELIAFLPARAVLMVNCQSVIVNKKTQEATFTIVFNKAPDFSTVDSFGRQATSFQYFINLNGGLPVFKGSPYYSKVKTIIRGQEIHVAGKIPVRNTLPLGSSEPNSGGWGSVRSSVPYMVNGNVLEFSTSLQSIRASNAQFSYRLEWYEFGKSGGGLDAKPMEGKHKKKPEACVSSVGYK